MAALEFHISKFIKKCPDYFVIRQMSQYCHFDY